MLRKLGASFDVVKKLFNALVDASAYPVSAAAAERLRPPSDDGDEIFVFTLIRSSEDEESRLECLLHLLELGWVERVSAAAVMSKWRLTRSGLGAMSLTYSLRFLGFYLDPPKPPIAMKPVTDADAWLVLLMLDDAGFKGEVVPGVELKTLPAFVDGLDGEPKRYCIKGGASKFSLR
jgi:hypothetical protein